MIVKLLIFVFCACVFQAIAEKMVGGWSSVQDTNSLNFQKIQLFAAKEISSQMNSPYKMKPIEVLSAKQQVVAGMKYKFHMRIGTTGCKIDENTAIEECDVSPCGVIHKCNATVWDRAWLNDTRLTAYSCDKESDSCADKKEK